MGDVCPLSVDGIVDRLYDSPVHLCKADCDTPGMAAVACAAINEVLEKQAEPADEDMKRQHTIRCFMLDQKLGFAKEIRLGDVRASWATDSHWDRFGAGGRLLAEKVVTIKGHSVAFKDAAGSRCSFATDDYYMAEFLEAKFPGLSPADIVSRFAKAVTCSVVRDLGVDVPAARFQHGLPSELTGACACRAVLKCVCGSCQSVSASHKVCQGCKMQGYCSAACHKLAWTSHRHVCKLIQRVQSGEFLAASQHAAYQVAVQSAATASGNVAPAMMADPCVALITRTGGARRSNSG